MKYSIYPSSTNPKDRTTGPKFEELKASVKEVGILTPILVRKTKKGREIVAGHRRFAAAVALGIPEKDIPVREVEMNDTEAQEAQIIENLQREDLHPLDEGAAYRALTEAKKGKVDIAELAAKVGKSQSYVRGRLVLTNLDAKIEKEVRDGKIPVAHAVELGRISKPAQLEVLKDIRKSYGSRLCSLSELRDSIATLAFAELRKSPPWEDDAAMKAEIMRVTGIKADEEATENLFGEKTFEKIENPQDYARALTAFIELTKRKYAADGKPLTLISSEYSTTMKGVLGRNQYDSGPGYYGGKCKSFHDALVVDGDRDLGKVIKICTNKQCPAHNSSSSRPSSPADAKKQREARKKQLAAERAKKERQNKLMAKAVGKMKSPVPPKQVDVLLDLAIKRAHYDTLRVVANRRELSEKGKRYDDVIKAAVKGMNAAEKAGLLLEVMIPAWSIGPDLSRLEKAL